MKKPSVGQLKELFEFYYEYDDLVTIKNHIEYVINNIDSENYDIVSHDKIHEQEMDNMKFCGCGCILAKNEYKYDDWIAPYIEKCGDKTFIGYSLYEEHDEPKLYYV